MVSDSIPQSRRDSQVTPTFYYPKFEELCPFFLSIGMTYDQFWNQDCALTKYYLKAYKIKQKRENHKLWLQGLYIYEALCDVSPVMNAFAKKGTKPIAYPAEPYSITPEDKKAKEEKEHQLRLEKLKATLLSKVKKE